MVGITRQAVNDLVVRGVLKLTDGLIDPDEADQQLLQLDPAKSKALQSIPHQPELQAVDQAPPAADADAEGEDITTFHLARTKKEKYAAASAKMQYLKEIGALVAADEVREQMFSIERRLRDNIMAIADRMAAVLAAENDPVRVRHLLNEEHRKSMHEFSRAAAAIAAERTVQRNGTLQ